jgi:uncharacterized membrane protein SirB2
MLDAYHLTKVVLNVTLFGIRQTTWKVQRNTKHKKAFDK